MWYYNIIIIIIFILYVIFLLRFLLKEGNLPWGKKNKLNS